MLCRHILAARSIPILAHCKAVLIFESNLAFESQHLLHALEANGIKNWVSLSEGQQGTLGWLTTNERKEQMCLLLREAMTVGRIAISQFFFSVELEKLEGRKRIKDELLNYCVVTEAPKTTFGKVRVCLAACPPFCTQQPRCPLVRPPASTSGTHGKRNGTSARAGLPQHATSTRRAAARKSFSPPTSSSPPDAAVPTTACA